MHHHLPGCRCGDHAQHSRIVTNARARPRGQRQDPSRTSGVRRRWEAELRRRFAQIRRLIRDALVEQDVLGLTQLTSLSVSAATSLPPPRAFQFMRDPEKVSAFMDWLNNQMYLGLLDVQLGTPVRAAAETAWTSTYVQSAYRQGLINAGSELRRGGATVADRFIDAAFLRPVHADRAGLIFTRTYQSLSGVTDAMSSAISRELAQAMLDGVGAREIARRLSDRVDKIGLTRARVIARTETVAASAEATLNMYTEARIEGVTVMSEFTTAGDDQVCPECQALEGQVRTIEEARGVIPVHPNCRCTWLPVVTDGQGVVLD